MKKKDAICMALGLTLVGAGMFILLYSTNAGAPLLVFLGSVLLTTPFSFPAGLWKKALDVSWSDREPRKDEPLYLAKLFMMLSWVARHCGILELCDTKLDQGYTHPLYWFIKSMTIDGMDPEYIHHATSLMAAHIRQREKVSIQLAKQVGGVLFCTGLFGSIATISGYIFRWMDGQPFATESAALATILSLLCFLGGATNFFLVPGRLEGEFHHRQQIQQQIRYGWQNLQHGNTPESILQEQLAFLSKSQRKAMTDNPIPKIAEEEYANKYPSFGLAALRQEFTAALKQYESQCIE